MPRPASRSATVATATAGAFLDGVRLALAADTVNRALAALDIALGRLVPGLHTYFGVFCPDAPPILLGAHGDEEWNRVYPQGYYLLDPSYERYLTLERSTCLLPADAFPREFRASEYYLNYCRPMRMVDEVCYLVPLGSGLAAYVSAMRLGEARPFTRSECARFEMALPIVDVAMQHVYELFGREHASADARSRDLHRHLSDLFETFGRELLSGRELEVTRLLLKGLTPKVVGRLLRIAPGTVRNHIKAIYLKLGVRSQPELMALFFESLRASPRE
jgi:DNA-binding CsgD family transcriptional regulator